MAVWRTGMALVCFTEFRCGSGRPSSPGAPPGRRAARRDVPIDDARANAASLAQARLISFPGDLHDVLNEHDRDVVHESVAAFVIASTGLAVARV